MSDLAAFRAVYADWKLVKTRGVVQVVLELPVEASGQAYDVLGGMPDPGKSVWCGIARLEVTPKAEANNNKHSQEKAVVSESDPPARPPASKPSASLTRQAVFLCKTPKFQQFLRERFEGWWHDASPPGETIPPHEAAAQIMRRFCEVKSRRDILPGTEAEQFLYALKADFQAWDLAPRAGISP
jgi:hypothetical protein